MLPEGLSLEEMDTIELHLVNFVERAYPSRGGLSHGMKVGRDATFAIGAAAMSGVIDVQLKAP